MQTVRRDDQPALSQMLAQQINLDLFLLGNLFHLWCGDAPFG
jgi:hypothetical protein